MSATIFHILQRQPRRGGNSFYRDKSARESKTFCGATVTLCDIFWNDAARDWIHPTRGLMVPCTDCMRRRRALKRMEAAK